MGVAVGETRRSSRDRPFIATRVERAGRNIGARGRAADPRVAVHHQRLGPVPAAHERNQRADVVVAGNGVAVHRRGDVVHAQNEVVVRCDAPRSFDPVGIPEQRDDVPRSGRFDRLVQAREGTDVNHLPLYMGMNFDIKAVVL